MGGGNTIAFAESSIAALSTPEKLSPKANVLHVPYTYFPDPSGGTEVYVQSLALQLAIRGYASSIAAPGIGEQAYRHAGIDVYRFDVDRRPHIEFAYGQPDKVAAASFRSIVARLRPAVVHLHARTAAVSELLVDIAHDYGARAVFTYHTPTASCARGTMLLFGRSPCDGALKRQRCTACALAGHGMPESLARVFGAFPAGIAQRLAEQELRSPMSALRIPGLLADAQARFHRLMSKVDHVVAVCDWVAEALKRNGVSPAKVLISRQGVAENKRERPRLGVPRVRGIVRIAYFGRLDPTKGVDLLVAALALVPDIEIRLDLYLVRQSGSDREFDAIQTGVLRDRRITIHSPIPSERIPGVMASYDMIVIPSRWLETGPLVLLEAFSAGVPVLGANHGGIAELVRDGVDGILFAPDNSRALADALAKVAANPSLIEKLRAKVQPPRTMAAVADEMAALYDRLLFPMPIAPQVGAVTTPATVPPL